MLVRSYRSAFILLFTALLVLTTAAVAFNAYRRAAEVSLGLSEDIIDQMSEKVMERTLAIFEAAYADLEINALALAGRGLTAERDAVFRLFWKQLALKPQLLSLFAANPAGDFLLVRDRPQLVTRWIDRSGERPREQVIYRDRDYAPIAHIEGGGLFDPRDQGWYQGALAARGTVTWSPVYRIAAVERPGITAAKTVAGADGKPALVVGVDIALDGLSEFLSDHPVAKGAAAMIVDERGRLVAYPYQLRLKERARDAPEETMPAVADLADPALVHAYSVLAGAADASDGQTRTAPGGFEILHTGGVRYLARMHAFPPQWTDGWRLFVVVPEASLLTEARRLLSESAVISFIILVVAVSLVSLLALRLFEPLRKLVRNTERVKQMRFAEVEPVRSRFVEIQAMDAAICDMRQSLETLERYVPAAVARGLMASGAGPSLGAEVVGLTLFCGGMAEFGRLCRAAPPERIAAILTGQLDQFTRILMRQRGTVDDYLGESIMAFWGAPMPLDDGPERACLAVLQCLQAEADLAREGADGPAGLARNLFAVHAGPCIVGNIGSQRHLSYSAIGDNVDLTWRLKQLNRLYGTRAIVTGPVQREVADAFWFRRLDLLPIHDGTEHLELFELQGERSLALPVEDELFARAYEEGLEALLAGDWGGAEGTFNALFEERPDDRSLHLMRRRCAARSILPCLAGTDLDQIADLAGAA